MSSFFFQNLAIQLDHTRRFTDCTTPTDCRTGTVCLTTEPLDADQREEAIQLLEMAAAALRRGLVEDED